jgi:chromosome segregation ATPase
MDQNQKFQKLMSDQKSVCLEKEILVKNLKDLQDNLELYEESEEDLKKLLQDYRKSLLEEKNNQDKLEVQREDISQDLAMLESSLSTHCTLKGTYQAQLDVLLNYLFNNRLIRSKLMICR